MRETLGAVNGLMARMSGKVKLPEIEGSIDGKIGALVMALNLAPDGLLPDLRLKADLLAAIKSIHGKLDGGISARDRAGLKRWGG